MSVEFTVQSVRELKGAPLAILCLLALSTLPVTQEWLERNSGYTDKPISQALAYLRETGRICRTSQGWMLAAGFQLPLPMGESRNISDSVFVLESTPIDESLNTLINNNNKSRNISDSIWEELARASVKRNDRTEALVQMEHITFEYVEAKRLEFKHKNMGGYHWAGLFIKALENNEPIEGQVIEVREKSYAEQQLEESRGDEPIEKFCTWQENGRSPYCHAPISSGHRCAEHGGSND